MHKLRRANRYLVTGVKTLFQFFLGTQPISLLSLSCEYVWL